MTSDGKVTDADVAELKRALPTCKIMRNNNGEVVKVDLFGTEVTDVGLVHLKGMTKLYALWLNGTQVTDAGGSTRSSSL